MSEATLAIRPGEIVYVDRAPFRDDVPGEHQYCVALLSPPTLPGEAHNNTVFYAVVAVQQYRVNGVLRWGWVHIPPESKQQIGDLLLKAHAEPNRWYWLLVSPHDDVFVSTTYDWDDNLIDHLSAHAPEPEPLPPDPPDDWDEDADDDFPHHDTPGGY